ncbi:MAG: type IV toxin-antitoxin system AbiEi family antitoxin domain-containing protein [Dehalococcoidia bacterium]
MKVETTETDLRGLEALALQQGGYFNRADAREFQLSDQSLHYHVQAGRFERIFLGVFRLRTAPTAIHDDILLAWVWSNYRGAISHESALDLLDLSDVMPSQVQMTVPKGFGRTSAPFILHHANLSTDEVMPYEGVRVTTPERTIVDAASTGTDPEQVQKAVQQALRRALVSADRLRRAALRPGYRHRRTVVPLIQAAIDHAQD